MILLFMKRSWETLQDEEGGGPLKKRSPFEEIAHVSWRHILVLSTTFTEHVLTSRIKTHMLNTYKYIGTLG